MNWRLAAAVWLGCGLVAADADYDLIIRGGRVVDGSGNPAQLADVAIREGRVVRVGRVTGGAARELDATGLVVAPGFIDVHTHADDIAELPLAGNFVRMGVTTVIAGNCGSSAVDVARFFQRIEATNVSANVAVLIGQGSVRSQVMGGSFRRPATATELDRMRALVEQAMRDGAAGMSTGLIYLPGTFTPTEELVELAKVVGRFDGVYASHMRDEGRGIRDALAEAFRIGREAGVRVEISHLKLSGNASWGQAAGILALIEEARRTGLDVTQDQYVYTASSTGISQLVPEEFREGGRFKERLANADDKAAMKAVMRDRLAANQRPDYRYAVIADFPADRSLNGLSLPVTRRGNRSVSRHE